MRPKGASFTPAATLQFASSTFLRQQSTTMDSYIPKPLAQILATVGLLYVSAKVFSYVRLLASLFLIPGVPVSISTMLQLIRSNILSSLNSDPRVVGQ